MAAPDYTISGKDSAGVVAGNVISGVHKFNWEETADNLDGTIGGDGGFRRTDTGTVGLKITLDCYFDLAEAVITPFRPGSWVEDLLLYNDVSASPEVDMPLGKVLTIRKTSEARGRLEFTIEIESFGEYTINDP